MKTIYVQTDGWEPMYSIETDPFYESLWKKAEISDEEFAWIEGAFREFQKVQDFLKGIYRQDQRRK